MFYELLESDADDGGIDKRLKVFFIQQALLLDNHPSGHVVPNLIG